MADRLRTHPRGALTMSAKKKASKHKAPAKKSAVKKGAVKKGEAKKKQAPHIEPATPPAKQPDQPGAAPVLAGSAAGAGSPSGLRVRMYRVGFGDFFLVSVPVKAGFKHILIDCGVHS